MSEFFYICDHIIAKAPLQMQNETTKNLWHHFTFTESEISFTNAETLLFQIGQATPPQLNESDDFSYTVDESGIAIVAKTYPSLMRL